MRTGKEEKSDLPVFRGKPFALQQKVWNGFRKMKTHQALRKTMCMEELQLG